VVVGREDVGDQSSDAAAVDVVTFALVRMVIGGGWVSMSGTGMVVSVVLVRMAVSATAHAGLPGFITDRRVGRP